MLTMTFVNFPIQKVQICLPLLYREIFYSTSFSLPSNYRLWTFEQAQEE